MKILPRSILAICIPVCIAVATKAQEGCSAYSLQKSDSLVFTRIMPPPYDPVMAKMKPKEKAEYLKKQNEDIKNGVLKLKEGIMTIAITDKEPTATGFEAKARLNLVNPTGTYTVPYVYQCINDTLYTMPEQQYTETEGVGITYTGAVAYPLKMKKGDLLPDNRNITIGYKRTGSIKFMMPYVTKETTVHHVDYDGSELYKTVERTWANKEVTDNFSSMTTMETVYANRQVTGDTSYSYKGKTYKGFIISCYLLTTTKTDITADYYQKATQRIMDRAMARAQRKLTEDEDGLYTIFIQELFVPELGVVSSLMTRKDGSFFSRSYLAN
jgi:hypothetical protein